MVRIATVNFDKTELIDDLKLAGFEDSIAEAIADRVDSRKSKDWTYDMGRQEAIKEAQALLERTHRALDRFRSSTLSKTGQHFEGQESLAGKIADPGMQI